MTRVLRKAALACLILATVFFYQCSQKTSKVGEWVTIFDGQSLEGWVINENPEGFSIEDGALKAVGERAHMFYNGPVADGNFSNFEVKMKIKTLPEANSGFYIHTKFQEDGWPGTGHEAQVNQSHIGGGDYRELKKSGSLYSVRNIYKQLVPDNEWYDYRIKVVGNHVQIYLNDILTVNYFEPAMINPADSLKRLNGGTFGIQCHDPGSTVYFKDIQVKVLPEQEVENSNPVVLNDTHKKMMGFQGQQHSFTDMNLMYNDEMDLDRVMDFFYRTGINAGLMIDLSGDHTAQTIADHVEKFKSFPVFIGGYLSNGGDDVPNLTSLDYIAGPAGTMPEITSSSIEFMFSYTGSIIKDLNEKPINIWTNATDLPEELLDQYNDLWTEDVMNQLIDAAVANNIAIAIDNESRMPSIDFIKLAKSKGAKFTYSNLDYGNEMGNLDYIFEVIEACELNYKDVFIPNP